MYNSPFICKDKRGIIGVGVGCYFSFLPSLKAFPTFVPNSK